MASYLPYYIVTLLILLAIPILGASLDRILNALMSVIHFIANLYQTFIQSAPSFVKTYLFIFMVVLIGGGLVSFIIGLNYGCTSENQLKSFNNMIGGVMMTIEVSLSGNQSAEKYDEYLNNPNVTTNAIDYGAYNVNNVWKIECKNTTPVLEFLGIQIFNLQFWALVMFLGIILRFMYR